MSITKKDIKKLIQDIWDKFMECRPAWDSMLRLKLYDVAYECKDIVDKICDDNGLKRPESDEEYNDIFYWYCDIVYEDFQYWYKEKYNEDVEDQLAYIGSTSAFYIGGVGNVNGHIDNSFDEFLEVCECEIADYIGLTFDRNEDKQISLTINITKDDLEYINGIFRAEDIEYYREKAFELLDKWSDIYNYITDSLDNQVKYFTEFEEMEIVDYERYEPIRKPFSEFPVQKVLNYINSCEEDHIWQYNTPADSSVLNDIVTVKQILERSVGK